jgi:Na+/H+ antiporter NhaD/arsenite permease-like protein
LNALVVAVFAATYLGMALGRVPGLRVDRTGIALMALAVLLATGALDIDGFARAVDAPTIMLLFALMILSAQFAAAGFYDLCARAITAATTSPSGLLALTVAVAGGLSALLANDIVVYAMTPLLCAGIGGRGRDPRPYLMALVGASNAGSAATVIGNPQNILIGQIGRLDFWQFLAVCAVPSLVALILVFLCVRLAWRHALAAPYPPVAAPGETVAADRWQTVKGAAATAVMIALFATPLPREIGALAVAAALLASRRLASREMIGAVDWHLLLLFACLFALTASFADTGLAREALVWLEAHGYLPDRLVVLAPLALLMSNTIGNVPSVILLMAVWPQPGTGALYGLALLSTLAGNFLIVGSIANLIVAERAARAGVRLSFADFARAGVPMTLASMAVAVVWLGLGGWMRWV